LADNSEMNGAIPDSRSIRAVALPVTRAGTKSAQVILFAMKVAKEGMSMCKTCRRHHPELYPEKQAEKPEKEKEPSPKRK